MRIIMEYLRGLFGRDIESKVNRELEQVPALSPAALTDLEQRVHAIVTGVGSNEEKEAAIETEIEEAYSFRDTMSREQALMAIEGIEFVFDRTHYKSLVDNKLCEDFLSQYDRQTPEEYVKSPGNRLAKLVVTRYLRTHPEMTRDDFMEISRILDKRVALGKGKPGYINPVSAAQAKAILIHQLGGILPDVDLRNVSNVQELQEKLSTLKNIYVVGQGLQTLRIPYQSLVDIHELAKIRMDEAMQTCPLVKDCKLTIVKAGNDAIDIHSMETTGDLDPAIFSWGMTPGVQHFIRAAQSDNANPDIIHVFAAASQYNSAEATGNFTPASGNAMGASEHDHTQGPFAQRENPALFELVNTFLANVGFNQLAGILSEEGYQAYGDGYLTPHNEKQLNALIRDFEANWGKGEIPAYQSKNVHLILSAAPALGGYDYDQIMAKFPEQGAKLQYLAAIMSFSGQFNRILQLLEEHKTDDKKVVFHMTGVGLGVFGNNPAIVGQAFKKAALNFQEKLREMGIPADKVKVKFESYGHSKEDVKDTTVYDASGLTYSGVAFGKEFETDIPEK